MEKALKLNMWTLYKIILLIIFFTAPGWLFIMALFLGLYFAFWLSMQDKAKQPEKMPLPTWVLEDSFNSTYQNLKGALQRLYEILIRMGAKIQGNKNKKKQTTITLKDQSPSQTEVQTVQPVIKQSVTCPKCGTPFADGNPQICHLSDCYYE